MSTYLTLVNNVLTRLREPTVSSVQDNSYSKLIGVYINDAKREIEDAHEWNALLTTKTITTVSGTKNYTVTGSGMRFKVVDVMNDTRDFQLEYAPTVWLDRQYIISGVSNSVPSYYNFSGVDSNGDTKVNLFPIPDGVYSINFNMIIPQADLSADSDTVSIPSHLVGLLAYAKAIAERGEDSGILSSEAYQLYRLALADAIAIERNRYAEEVTWVSP